MIGQAVYTLQGTAGNIPLAAAFTVVPMADHGRLSVDGKTHGGLRCPLTRTIASPLGLRISAIAGLLFLHLPLALIFLYAFTTEEKSFQFPPPGLHHANGSASRGIRGPTSGRRFICRSKSRPSPRCSPSSSARLPPPRCRAPSFFGRETISLLFVLPIALPGIITGIALRSAFDIMSIPFLDLDDHSRPRNVLHRRRL